MLPYGQLKSCIFSQFSWRPSSCTVSCTRPSSTHEIVCMILFIIQGCSFIFVVGLQLSSGKAELPAGLLARVFVDTSRWWGHRTRFTPDQGWEDSHMFAVRWSICQKSHQLCMQILLHITKIHQGHTKSDKAQCRWCNYLVKLSRCFVALWSLWGLVLLSICSVMVVFGGGGGVCVFGGGVGVFGGGGVFLTGGVVFGCGGGVLFLDNAWHHHRHHQHQITIRSPNAAEEHHHTKIHNQNNSLDNNRHTKAPLQESRKQDTHNNTHHHHRERSGTDPKTHHKATEQRLSIAKILCTVYYDLIF